MKTLLLTLFVAAAAFNIGRPAVANAHLAEAANWQQDDWNNGGDSYAAFDQEYRHIWDGIRHGVNDGSYTPREADYFYQQLQAIRVRADWQARRGFYDGDQIQTWLEHLHDRMHTAHQRGHDDRYNYGNADGYGDGQPGYGNPYGDPDPRAGYSFSFGIRR